MHVGDAVIELAAEELMSKLSDRTMDSGSVQASVQFLERLDKLTPEGRRLYFEAMGK